MPALTVAEASQSQQVTNILSLLVWLVVISVGTVAVGVWIYHRTVRSVGTRAETSDFSLADLRRLRDEGQISEAEYQRARAQQIGQGRALIETDNDATGGSASDTQLSGGDSGEDNRPDDDSDKN